MTKPHKLGSRGKPEETRSEILEAAIQEFATLGVAGARTDSIAQAAGVNKALLYYYFSDKEALYAAVLDTVFSGLVGGLHGILQSNLDAGEKILRYALTHFDYIASHREYGRLVQHEMMRAQAGHSEHVGEMVRRYFKPLLLDLARVLTEGAERGELRRVDPIQFAISMTGINVFYFISAPVQKGVAGVDPFSPERLQLRRVNVADMLASTIFVDQEKGRALAEGVLRDWKYEPPKKVRGDNKQQSEPAGRGGAGRHRGRGARS